MKRFFLYLVFLPALCWGFMDPVYAEDPQPTEVSQEDPENHIPEPEIPQSAEEPVSEDFNVPDEPVIYTTVEEAGTQLREQMKNRDEEIVFYYDTESRDYRGILHEIYAYAFTHNGNPDEGDYLYYQYGNYHCKITGYVSQGTSHVTYTNQLSYYSTKEQEEIVDCRVPEILSSLELEHATEAEKVEKIYGFIRDSVHYDYQHSGDPSYVSKYTAYAAIVDQSAVCQGFSVLFYRLCLESGLDSRIISGTTNSGQKHSWNIVKVGDQYYDVDTTWANSGNYLLKGENDFSRSHHRDEEYTTLTFLSAYPMALEDFVFDPVGPAPENEKPIEQAMESKKREEPEKESRMQITEGPKRMQQVSVQSVKTSADTCILGYWYASLGSLFCMLRIWMKQRNNQE